MIAHRPDWIDLATARLGRADRRLLLRRAAGRSSGRRAPRRARGRHLPGRARAPTSGTRARRASCCRRARTAPSAAARPSARRRTSSTSGSTRAAATPPCSRRVRSCAGPPRCTSKARTSTAAGSTPRCWRRWARATRPALPRGADPRVRGGRRRAQDVQVAAATTSTPEELIPKYGAEVLRLWVAAEDYTEDIRLSDEILNRLADAYRRIRNTFRFLLGTSPTSIREPDRRPYERLEELDRWALLAPRRADRAGARAPTRSTSSTWSSTRSTTSARWTSRRSTWTSSRTGSTPRRPGRPAAARRADGVLRGAYRARPGCWRRSSRSPTDEVWSPHARGRGKPRACTS